jgi:hypothetical protein
MQKFFVVIILFLTVKISAQITGTIKDTNGKNLSTVSVYLESSLSGTTSNDNGYYYLPVTSKGNYTVVFQYLGYQLQKKQIQITEFPYQLNVILQEEQVILDEVLISSEENPANEIIRNTIAAKEKNTDKFKTYTAKFYSRGLYKIKNAPKKFLGQNLGDFGGGLDTTRSGIIYLSETVSKIAYQKKPKQFKEKIIASKVSGRDNGISFNRAEDANINFYTNKVDFGNELISPIANNAFSYYTYQLEGSFYNDDKRLINKIKIIPKRKNAPVFSGSIYIVEDEWSIYGTDVFVTGAQANLPIVDTLKLKQNYNYTPKNKAWVLISQQIDFKVNIFGFNFNGKFASGYSEYNFKPDFKKSTFSNEILSFEKNATKKDTTYWNTLRPVPLTKEEIRDYSIKDSIKVVRKSKPYLDSINKVQNKFNFISPITGYTYRNSYEKWALNFDGLIDNFSFNTVQGFNTSIGVNYFKRQNNKGKWFTFGAKVNYGFSDDRVRPFVFFNKNWNNTSRPKLTFVAGLTTQQFNEREPIFKLNNTLNSLFFRNNYMKIFEKDFAKISFSQEVKNGFYLNTSLEYAGRKPLFNTTNYFFTNIWNDKPYTSNNPLDEKDFASAPFKGHEIATLNIGATFIFGQKYLSYPNGKFNIGNPKIPSLNINYRKRFGATEGRLNSDLFIANIRQKFKIGSYGDFAYHLRGGIFLKKKNLAFMDNLQANGNQLFFPIDHELNSFNILEYYRFFTNDRTAEAHFEHNFKGAILSKIPLVNQLNFHLVIGAKYLFMDNITPYSEYSIGLDNLGYGKWRVFRFEYVNSFYKGIQETGFVFAWKFF